MNSLIQFMIWTNSIVQNLDKTIILQKNANAFLNVLHKKVIKPNRFNKLYLYLFKYNKRAFDNNFRQKKHKQPNQK